MDIGACNRKAGFCVQKSHVKYIMRPMIGDDRMTHGALLPHLSLLNILKTNISLSCMMPMIRSNMKRENLCTICTLPMTPMPTWNFRA